MRHRVSLAAIGLVLGLAAPSAQNGAAHRVDAYDLAPGQTQSIAIDVPEHGSVRIDVDGRGTWLSLTIADTTGAAIVSRERRAGLRTPITSIHLATHTRSIVATLQSLEKAAPSRRVSVTIDVTDRATPADSARAAASEAVARAEALERSGAAQLAAARVQYEEARGRWREAGDVSGEAAAALEIGRLLAESGESQKARDTFLLVRSLCRDAGDRVCESAALHRVGRLDAATGRPAEAFEHLQAALAIREELSDQAGQAETQMELGSLDATRSENARAATFFARALELAKAAGDRRTEADALNTRAVQLYGLGDLEQARSLYESALAIRTAIGDEPGQGQTTSNLGVLHRSLGDPRTAITYYQDALAIRRRLGATQPLANTLHNLGVAHADLGEHERALALFQEALTIWQQSGGRRGEAFTLQAMGQSYARVGQADKALELFTRCTPLWTQVGDKRGAAQTLLAAAAIEVNQRQYTRAAERLADALTTATDGGYKREVGIALAGRATVQRLQGRFEPALVDARQAQATLGGIGERREEGRAWTEIGATLLESGHADQAETAFREALTRFEDVEDRGEQASVRARLARTRDRAGDVDEARRQMLAALDLIESARATLNTEGLGASLFASKRAFYEDALPLFEPADAFAISERMRARGLLDLLASGEWIAPSEHTDSAIADRRRLQDLINNKAARLTRLLATTRTSTGPTVEAARRELDDLLLRLDAARADTVRRDPAIAGVAQPTPATLADVQDRLLDTRTVLLEYALGTTHGYGWAITKTDYVRFDLPGRDALERLAQQAYDSLTADARLSTAAVQQLSTMLLQPAATSLQGRSRVVIVGDGALQSIPFAALAAPGRTSATLGSTHEVVMLPSASVGMALAARASHATRAVRIAVFADPVFSADDTRLTVSTRGAQESTAPQLPRLRFSRMEADRIATLAPKQTTLWADFAANRATALTTPLSDYDVVHLAAHALIDGERPQLSGIVLSQVDRAGRPQDGLLRLHEVYSLSLHARLVVLSACRTALGRDVPGEGLIGFARGFLYAGADAVIGTLWAVDDRATAEFMSHFYAALLEKRVSPATALTTARRAMQRDPRWSHPQHWAAFVLIGYSAR